MLDMVIAYEPALRFAAFVGVFAIAAGWETLGPRRTRRFPRSVRWPHNLGLLAVNGVLLRLVAPGAAVGRRHGRRRRTVGGCSMRSICRHGPG